MKQIRHTRVLVIWGPWPGVHELGLMSDGEQVFRQVKAQEVSRNWRHTEISWWAGEEQQGVAPQETSVTHLNKLRCSVRGG